MSAAPNPESSSPPQRAAAGGAVDFLAGGGEMGERMRALDWRRTPLGPPEHWPQSLKTIVRVMLDSRYAMWMLWGPDLTFFCNDAYLPTVGIKRDWVLGARSDQVWEEIWPDIGPRIARVLAQGDATWDEGLLLFLERSGFPEETYHTFSYSPTYDDDGRIAGMLCVVTEVTERVVGERRLRVLRDLAARRAEIGVAATCRRLCEVMALYPYDMPFAAVYLIDAVAVGKAAAGRVAQLAACTHALPEATLPPMLALDATAPWPVAPLLQAETPQTAGDLGALSIRTDPWGDGLQQAKVLPLNGQHGMTGFLIIGVSPRRPLDDAYRAFLGLVAVQAAAAIAEAQAFETERRRLELLSELDRAKTAFFSNVSHEFRTPLTLMLGPLEEVLGDERVTAGVRGRLELARRNAMRLQKLVNTLLDFSRIEAGRVDASFEETDLAAATRDLASTFRSTMERAGLAYTVDCDDLGEPVYIDREMWEKIVLNLLSNAFKFTLEGAVSVRLVRADSSALLEVADTGAGVPEHELPRLFERFHRVESTQGRTHEGSGIGLALVHELVKLHGGTIDVSSRLGDGTSFRVQVPFGAAHLPADRVRPTRAQSSTAIGAQSFVEEAMRWLRDPAETSPSGVPPAGESPASRDRRFADTFGARIVLADDNADMLAYVRDLLSPFYRVEGVGDGMAALEAARRQRPDLILADVMMPRLGGYGLLEAVRSDHDLRSTPVLLLSARAGEEARIEGLDAGADDYVFKPFSARELLARVGALIELRRMRRAAEEGLRRRTAQYETLLTDAPLGVFLVDAAMRIRDVNPTAREAFGDVPDLIGADFALLTRQWWPAAFADGIVARFRETLVTGKPFHLAESTETRRDRGSVEHYEWRISRIPLADGSDGVVCYLRDIAVHVRARAQLQAADRQKDEFLAMLAHELRSPLAPIRSASEVLARIAPPGSHAESAAAIVQRQVGNMTRLVDDLLDVSRITQGRIELRRRVVPLAEVIGHAVEVAAPLIKEKHQRISIASQQVLRVDADPERLGQCIANVLTNAAKYADPRGEIRVDSRDDGTEAVVTISDNGAGIAPELLPHVFELFVQGERTADRSLGGLGIGLSVVKRLVEMHGGRVTAYSPGLGAGSTFEIRLPLAERDADQPPLPAPPAVRPRRVLVVDDKQDAADSLAMILSLEGHQVESVSSGYEALARVETFRPEIALLDIGLPGMNGYELAARLRARLDLGPIRLIALTGYGHTEDIERARLAGFDFYLVKPADIHALQRAVEGTLPNPLRR